MAPRKYKHPSTDSGRIVPMYSLWHNMVGRCHNSKRRDYKWYGEKGVVVCQQWHNYDQFVDDIEASIGPYPGKGWTLDRIITKGNYEPGNVQWATHEVNNQHKPNIKLTMEKAREIRARYTNGHYSMRELGTIYGVTETQICAIINNKQWKE